MKMWRRITLSICKLSLGMPHIFLFLPHQRVNFLSAAFTNSPNRIHRRIFFVNFQKCSLNPKTYSCLGMTLTAVLHIRFTSMTKGIRFTPMTKGLSSVCFPTFSLWFSLSFVGHSGSISGMIYVRLCCSLSIQQQSGRDRYSPQLWKEFNWC